MPASTFKGPIILTQSQFDSLQAGGLLETGREYLISDAEPEVGLTPTITIESEQVLSSDPVTIAFTADQLALLSNDGYGTFLIDMTASSLGKYCWVKQNKTTTTLVIYRVEDLTVHKITITLETGQGVESSLTYSSTTTWGNITGSIEDQSDLQQELASKADVSDIPVMDNQTIILDNNAYKTAVGGYIETTPGGTDSEVVNVPYDKDQYGFSWYPTMSKYYQASEDFNDIVVSYIEPLQRLIEAGKIAINNTISFTFETFDSSWNLVANVDVTGTLAYASLEPNQDNEYLRITGITGDMGGSFNDGIIILKSINDGAEYSMTFESATLGEFTINETLIANLNWFMTETIETQLPAVETIHPIDSRFIDLSSKIDNATISNEGGNLHTVVGGWIETGEGQQFVSVLCPDFQYAAPYNSTAAKYGLVGSWDSVYGSCVDTFNQYMQIKGLAVGNNIDQFDISLYDSNGDIITNVPCSGTITYFSMDTPDEDGSFIRISDITSSVPGALSLTDGVWRVRQVTVNDDIAGQIEFKSDLLGQLVFDPEGENITIERMWIQLFAEGYIGGGTTEIIHPIDSRFVPIDGQTLTVDGSNIKVNIDNQTLSTDGGTLHTAIGGGVIPGHTDTWSSDFVEWDGNSSYIRNIGEDDTIINQLTNMINDLGYQVGDNIPLRFNLMEYGDFACEGVLNTFTEYSQIIINNITCPDLNLTDGVYTIEKDLNNNIIDESFVSALVGQFEIDSNPVNAFEVILEHETPSQTIPIDASFIPVDGTTITVANNQLKVGEVPATSVTGLSTVATTGSYSDLTNQPTIPDAVSGTNDGTNWTTITIGSDTYGVGSGSSGGTSISNDIECANNSLYINQFPVGLCNCFKSPKMGDYSNTMCYRYFKPYSTTWLVYICLYSSYSGLSYCNFDDYMYDPSSYKIHTNYMSMNFTNVSSGYYTNSPLSLFTFVNNNKVYAYTDDYSGAQDLLEFDEGSVNNVKSTYNGFCTWMYGITSNESQTIFRKNPDVEETITISNGTYSLLYWDSLSYALLIKSDFSAYYKIDFSSLINSETPQKAYYNKLQNKFILFTNAAKMYGMSLVDNGGTISFNVDYTDNSMYTTIGNNITIKALATNDDNVTLIILQDSSNKYFAYHKGTDQIVSNLTQIPPYMWSSYISSAGEYIRPESRGISDILNGDIFIISSDSKFIIFKDEGGSYTPYVMWINYNKPTKLYYKGSNNNESGMTKTLAYTMYDEALTENCEIFPSGASFKAIYTGYNNTYLLLSNRLTDAFISNGMCVCSVAENSELYKKINPVELIKL